MRTVDWTISIIIQDDGVYKNEIDLDLLFAVRNAPVKPSVRYIIFRFDQKTKRSVIQTTTGDSLTGKTAEILIDSNDSLYNLQTLANFFNLYVLSEAGEEIQSKRHMVITWGHGAGIGLFYDTEINNTVDLGLEGLTEFSNNNTKPLDDTHSPHLITVPGFRTALLKSFGKKKAKIDLLLCMNCYMQNFETGYALRDLVTVLITSEKMLPFAGFNYASLFNLLSKKDLTQDLDKIYDEVLNGFEKKYAETSTQTDYSIYKQVFKTIPLSLSVNKLIYYDSVFKIVNKLAGLFTKNIEVKINNKRLSDLLILVRLTCKDVSPGNNTGFIDFVCFIEKIIEEIKTEDRVHPLLKKLEIQYHYLIEISKDSVYKILNDPRLTIDPNNTPRFFSIFFPNSDDAAISNEIRTIYNTTHGNDARYFKRIKPWVEFINVYYAKRFGG
ncbi:MAG: clostripain-related cysteine peptidase [Panacibacter sp.]